MPNIKFNYRYRNGANYKNHGFVIFGNPKNLDVDNLQRLIKSKLIDETWFYVDQWHLPDLHFGTWDNEIDHTWHEFECVDYTNDLANTHLGVSDFISILQGMKDG